MMNLGYFLLCFLAVAVLSAGETDYLRGKDEQQRKLQTQISDRATQQRFLANARERWRVQGSTKPAYRYNFNHSCIELDTTVEASRVARCNNLQRGAFPWRVQVTRGSAASAVDSNRRQQPGALSVEQMFDRIDIALRGEATGFVGAIYEPTIGYPTSYELGDGFNSSVYAFLFETGSPQQQLTQSRTVWESQKILDYNFTYYVSGPNLNNIQWPLSVQVKNGSPIMTKDRNNNVVTYLVPQTFDQVFDMIQRQLNKPGSFIDNDYSKRGFARELHMAVNDIDDEIEYHFCSFDIAE